MTEPVIILQGLIKSYGSVRALRGLNLEVYSAELFGFLGPNGAGKTTTIRCLLDLIHPDAGYLRVLGIDPQKKPAEVKALIGYLPGELHLHDNLTGTQMLRYLNSLRGDAAVWSTVQQLAERLQLDLGRRIKNLSRGNKQKLGIIQALMHHPPLLLLDEPTSGLDPLMQQEVFSILRERQAQGATIFFSSHILGEVQALADRAGIIRNGRLVEVIQPHNLVDRTLHRLRVIFREPVESQPFAALPGVTVLGQESANVLLLQVSGEMDALVKSMADYPLSSFETEQPTLEEVFLAYYKNNTEEEER